MTGYKAGITAQFALLFEQIMLFDTVNIAVTGPNVLAPLLYNRLGDKALLGLLEQDAIKFVISEQMPIMIADSQMVRSVAPALINLEDQSKVTLLKLNDDDPDVPGAISATKIDIEKVVDKGFEIQGTEVKASEKKKLRSMLLDRHIVLERGHQTYALEITRQALRSGRLTQFGLTQMENIRGQPVDTGHRYLEVIDAILRYRFFLGHGMVSYFDEIVFRLFENGLDELSRVSRASERYDILAQYCQLPNHRVLFERLSDPFLRASKFRNTQVSRQFRNWFAETKTSNSTVDQIREYVEACSDRKGMFEEAGQKIIKVVAMASLSSLVGHVLGAEGAAEAVSTLLGGIAAPISDVLVEKSSEISLSLFDSFGLDTIKTGYSPKAYFHQLKKLQNKYPAFDQSSMQQA